MDAPLLLALARARLRAGEGSVQGAWASPRALALLWAAALAAPFVLTAVLLAAARLLGAG